MTARMPAHFGPDAIRAAVGYEDVLEPVATALADYSRGLGESPVAVFAPAGRDGDVHVKSAWLPGRPIFTVQVATWFLERARRGGIPGAVTPGRTHERKVSVWAGWMGICLMIRALMVPGCNPPMWTGNWRIRDSWYMPIREKCCNCWMRPQVQRSG
ncbi:hypothetical protein RB628_38620 [Streptomyces sp. ADMS]|uniref:hypothetical protein n=1 Tax=Streptomyces sp. ADMS TaxID=3071415 RepID=UPI00296E9805|nr:hypothetical protein [Streptomyces sp. ADMS]MDW4911073.1 hypothetical protein [Streptomyces sp. ADMS]